MSKFKALLIEDDEDDYILTLDLLEEIHGDNIELDWATTASGAREYFQNSTHDICLMDYRLGAETGVELVKQAIKFGYDTPIIMLTGQKDKSVDHSASQAGAADYLLKSELNSENLDRSIRYALSRKEIQQAKLESLRAEEKSRLKTQFLAHLSHELRTPLTAILGFAENLSGTLEDVEDKQKVDIIFKNGRHLLSLLNDVLDLSKIEAGKLTIEPSNIDFFALLSDVNALMKVHAQDKKLGFSVDALQKLPRTIRSDPKRLKQVLLNLINNAIKFTPNGEVKVEVGMEGERNNLLKFLVHDTGIGIEQDDLSKIFEAFERSSDSQNRLSQGTGLGLTISKQLAEKLGGTIKIDSQKGQGSTFTLTIEIGPQDSSDFETLSLDRFDAPEIEQHPLPKLVGSVMVVDDMRDIRTLVNTTLEKVGAEAILVENGIQAIEYCKKRMEMGNPIDLILMDIDMPYMDGFETAKTIREMGANWPIVAFTAAMMADNKRKSKEMNLDGLLTKPLDTSELLGVLIQFLKEDSKQAQGNAAMVPAKDILIIEDNADAARAQAQLIKSLGHKTHIALHCAEARSKISEQSKQGKGFEIVLLDNNLPDGKGLDFAQEIVQLMPGTKVFLVSGEQLGESKLHHIEQVLLKPIGLQELRAAVG